MCINKKMYCLRNRNKNENKGRNRRMEGKEKKGKRDGNFERCSEGEKKMKNE